ncbi:MAG TPA: LuxR family transcriptional regulator [Nocardioidaceae bacterium]
MATRYGPEERKLLESTAGQLYGTAIAHGHLLVDDPRLSESEDVLPALELLLDIGLLSLDGDSGRYLPVDPAEVQSRVVVPLGQQGADLLAESARWAGTFSALGQTYRKSPQVATRPVTEIRGGENINNYIQAVVNDCRRELLTAQPHGRRPAPELAVAVERDIKALNRGIRMRTLYQHSARQSPATREYVAEVTQHGAEVRTLDEFFDRLIVVDREVAIIPSSAGDQVAVAIHNSSLIAYLVDIFERSWERARPFTAHDARSERSIASDVRAMTIRLLVEGHSDPASAKRLGVSTRTYAGYIAALKEEYGVQTRFQLGYAMGRALGQTDASEGPDTF